MKKNVKNNVTRIVLSVLILALIPVMHLLATERPMSYEEYFSQERELTKTTNHSGVDWVGEPIRIFDGILDYFKENYPSLTDQVKIGNIFQERIVDGFTRMVCIATGDYTHCEVAGNTMYLAEGGMITKWNLNTLENQQVYQSNTPIKNLLVYDEIVFFQSGNSIYRYHVNSEKIDLIFQIDDLVFWSAVTNQTICYGVINSDYCEAVAMAGVGEHDVIAEPEEYVRWLNDRFDFNFNPEDSIFSQCELQISLMHCGIHPQNVFYYNSVLNETFSDYNFLGTSDTSSESWSPTILTNLMETQSQARSTLSGYAFSDTEFVEGSHADVFFSKNRYSGCNCHFTNSCDFSYNGGCDCLVHRSAIQCEAYARYMFERNTGYAIYWGSFLDSATMPSATSSSEMATYFQSLRKPFILRGISAETNRSHTVYVYYASDTQIGICEANTELGLNMNTGGYSVCHINNYQLLSYSEFGNRYINFTEVEQSPVEHSHTLVFSCTPTSHVKYCSTCGHVKIPSTGHTFLNDLCTVCGYLRRTQLRSFGITRQTVLTTAS